MACASRNVNEALNCRRYVESGVRTNATTLRRCKLNAIAISSVDCLTSLAAYLLRRGLMTHGVLRRGGFSAAFLLAIVAPMNARPAAAVRRVQPPAASAQVLPQEQE